MWILRFFIDVAIPAFTTYLASDDPIIRWLIQKQLSYDINWYNVLSVRKGFEIIEMFHDAFLLLFNIDIVECQQFTQYRILDQFWQITAL